MKTLIKLFMLISALATAVWATATSYYVDSSRTTNGDGSIASPWKLVSDINWTTIKAVSTDTCFLYFSSRDVWVENLTIGTDSGNASYLVIDGNSFYNTINSGTASWEAETDASHRAKFNRGSNITIPSKRQKITIKGFEIDTSTWGCIVIGADNPTRFVNNITIRDNLLNQSVQRHCIWFGYAEYGCRNINVIKNTCINSSLEAIYMGHYSYDRDSITGVVVDSNTVINCGVGTGQGDIDLKPPCFKAKCRYNVHYNVSGYDVGYGNATGNTIYCDSAEIIGNRYYGLSWGIQFTDYGAGSGKKIHWATITNNIINNCRIGIRFDATHATFGIDTCLVANNIFWGDSIAVQVSAGGGLKGLFINNIVGQSTYRDILWDIAPQMVFDYNLWYNPSVTGPFFESGKNFAYWQGLGHDPHGLNSDPQFTYYGGWVGNNDFRQSSVFSPTVNSGATVALVPIDIIGTARPQGSAYDVGPYEKITAVDESSRINRKVFTYSIASSRRSIVLVNGRPSSVSGGRGFDIRGRQLRSNQVRPDGIVITVTPH